MVVMMMCLLVETTQKTVKKVPLVFEAENAFLDKKSGISVVTFFCCIWRRKKMNKDIGERQRRLSEVRRVMRMKKRMLIKMFSFLFFFKSFDSMKFMGFTF